MLQLQGIRWTVACLLLVCFATQGVSSASIGSNIEINEDVYPEEYPLTYPFSEGSLLRRFPPTTLITCLYEHMDEIMNLTSDSTALAVDLAGIVAGIIREYRKCGTDLNCQMTTFVNAFTQVIQHNAKIRSFVTDLKSTVQEIFDCAQEGITTPPPTTLAPTTPAPITSPSTTMPAPITSPATTTPAPITSPSTTTPAPITSPATTTLAPITSPSTTTPAPITSPATTTPAPITSPATTTPAPATSPPASSTTTITPQGRPPSGQGNESTSPHEKPSWSQSLKNAFDKSKNIWNNLWSKPKN